MPEQKHMLYYMGSLNGDIRLFRQVWKFIKDYLDVGPATIFSSGNFGLGNPGFLDAVSKEIEGFATMHVAGGNDAREGWKSSPPPETSFCKIRPGIFVHSFGSCIKIQNFSTLFLGRGQSLPEDFIPYPKNSDYDPRPSEDQVQKIVRLVQQHVPDVVVSHAFPRSATSRFFQSVPKDDLRRKRGNDLMIPVLDLIENAYLANGQKKTWWFGGALNIKGRFQRTEHLEYVSLCSFIMVRAALASLEIVIQPSPYNAGKQLGGLAYA